MKLFKIKMYLRKIPDVALYPEEFLFKLAISYIQLDAE